MAREPPYSPQLRSNANIMRTYESRSFFSSTSGDTSLIRSLETLNPHLPLLVFLPPSFSFFGFRLQPQKIRDDDLVVAPPPGSCWSCPLIFSYGKLRIRDNAGPSANTLFLPMIDRLSRAAKVSRYHQLL
jgi:hypothetical protein